MFWQFLEWLLLWLDSHHAAWQVGRKKLEAIQALKLENLQEADFELGGGSEDCSDDDDDDDDDDDESMDPDLNKTLGIKDAKDKKPKKENVWEVASKVAEEDQVPDLKGKFIKFKAELGEDMNTVELKVHDLREKKEAKGLVKEALAAVGRCKPIVANLEKKLKGKFTRSEAKSDLENAFKALSILKTVKAQVFKALKD